MKLDGCRRLDRRYQIEGDVIHTTASAVVDKVIVSYVCNCSLRCTMSGTVEGTFLTIHSLPSLEI